MEKNTSQSETVSDCDEITRIFSDMMLSPSVCKKIDSSVLEVESREEKRSNNTLSIAFKDFVLQPNEYEIVTLINASLLRDVSLESIQTEFTHLKVEFRSLKLGDCIWVARDITSDASIRMLILPYIVLKDDRLLQEESRLGCRKCGFSRILHIKEENLKPTTDSVRVAHNVHCIGEFHYFEKVTGSQQETFRFLADLTLRLKRSFKEKSLRSCQCSCLPDHFSMIPEIIPLITWEEFSSLL